MEPESAELKLTIAKLIEIAYSTNKEVTLQIVRSKGNFTIKVNQNGQATLTGKTGSLIFNGKPVLEAIGAKIKRISILFYKDKKFRVKYKATFSLELISLSVRGSFDIEKLLTSCSGILCQAIRAIKNRNAKQERKYKQIMGGN